MGTVVDIGYKKVPRRRIKEERSIIKRHIPPYFTF